MAADFVYKIKFQYITKPKLLEQFGFNPYVSDDGEIIVAKPLILPLDCSIVKRIKKLFEGSHSWWLKDKSRTEEEMHDFDDYTFNEDGTVVMTPELEKEWTKAQIGFYATDGAGKHQLVIIDANQNEYYNEVVLQECAKEFVDELLSKGVILRHKINYKKKPKKQKRK